MPSIKQSDWRLGRELDPLAKDWVLEGIDPDWRDHFIDIDLAFDFYYEFNASEIDELLEHYDE